MSLYYDCVRINPHLCANRVGRKTVSMDPGKPVSKGSITAIQDTPEAVAFCTDHCPFPKNPDHCTHCRAFNEFAKRLITQKKGISV